MVADQEGLCHTVALHWHRSSFMEKRGGRAEGIPMQLALIAAMVERDVWWLKTCKLRAQCGMVLPSSCCTFALCTPDRACSRSRDVSPYCSHSNAFSGRTCASSSGRKQLSLSQEMGAMLAS